METPNLDKLLDQAEDCLDNDYGFHIHEPKLCSAAAQELIALRTAASRAAAPQKVDGPKVPGWYWARWAEKHAAIFDLSVWHCVHAYEIHHHNGPSTLHFYRGPGTCEADDFQDWHGPLTPPAAAAGEGADRG